jgi:hypothetical protein
VKDWVFSFCIWLHIWNPISSLQTLLIWLTLYVILNRNAGHIVWSVLTDIISESRSTCSPTYTHLLMAYRYSKLFASYMCVLILVCTLALLSVHNFMLHLLLLLLLCFHLFLFIVYIYYCLPVTGSLLFSDTLIKELNWIIIIVAPVCFHN